MNSEDIREAALCTTEHYALSPIQTKFVSAFAVCVDGEYTAVFKDEEDAEREAILTQGSEVVPLYGVHTYHAN